MRARTPKGMALYIAAVTSLVSTGVMLIFWDKASYSDLLLVLVAALSIGITLYVVSHRLITSFIFEKINPIYRTIQDLTTPDSEIIRKLEGKDIVNEVNREVQFWASNKLREIDHLKEMARYRKEFLGNVSHELKTPIFNIQGYVLTLLDGGLEDDTINRSYLERTEKSINRLISIVEDLEALSKLESKAQHLALEKVNIVSLVDEVFEAQEVRAMKAKISLQYDRAYERPIHVHIDRKLMYQAIANLVINSIKYGKPNGRTTVSFTEMPDRVMVEVNDDGIGIAQKDIHRIFERFYRVEKSRSQDQGGSGLGLAIVKHVIEAHGQTITVRSSLNEGTSFSFTLKKFLPVA